MRLEVGDVTPDLLTLRSRPVDRWYPVRFDDGARHHWFDANAFRKRLRVLDECIEIGFPVVHGIFSPSARLSALAETRHTAANYGFGLCGQLSCRPGQASLREFRLGELSARRSVSRLGPLCVSPAGPRGANGWTRNLQVCL